MSCTVIVACVDSPICNAMTHSRIARSLQVAATLLCLVALSACAPLWPKNDHTQVTPSGSFNKVSEPQHRWDGNNTQGLTRDVQWMQAARRQYRLDRARAASHKHGNKAPDNDQSASHGTKAEQKGK